MSITIRECTGASDLKTFARLPYRIYRNNRYWIPPLLQDEIKSLSAAGNPAFAQCEAAFWLAERQGRPVGRIAAIINREYNKKTGEAMGRFSRFECEQDPEAATLLLQTAEAWLRSKGMIGVHGPLGFNNLDGQGLLVEGFDQLPSIASTYHLPYYQKLIEDNGYEKENDWVEFRLTIGEVPEKALKLNESIKLRYKLKLITFSDTKQLVPYAPKVFRLLNEAFAELPYVSPFSEEMITFYSNKYFKFLNPRFVKLIEDEQGNMVAFIVSVPSLSKAMQKANGSLFPFGWWHILQAFKKPEVADLFLTGIDPKMQGQGVPAVLITELQKTMLDNGVKYVETTGIFETNHKAITTWKNYEHIQHKRRRCYRKLF
ncbi:MAG: hypothetical protein ACK5AS_09750 [Bacteroidota bacterium]